MTTINSFAILSTLLFACTDSTDSSDTPDASVDTEAANRDLLHRYHEDVWVNHRLDLAGNYLGQTFVAHSPPFSMPTAQPPGQDFFPRFFSAFPDLVSHEDALLSFGDRVAIQWTMTGTHTGDFYGLAATNRTFTVSGMDVLRVENGKFVEQWGGFADQMDEIIAQLQP